MAGKHKIPSSTALPLSKPDIMPTNSATLSPIPEALKDNTEDVLSDPEVETKQYTAPAPYVWETWQTEILNHYLPAYKTNKSVSQRTAILDRAFRKIKAKHNVPDSEVSELRKASFPSEILSESLIVPKAMKRWFSLKARVRKPKEYKIRGISWNYRTVAAVVKKQQIKEAEIKLAAGGPVIFGSYQAGLNNVLKDLNEEELDELKATTAKWNSEGPTEEEKNRYIINVRLDIRF